MYIYIYIYIYIYYVCGVCVYTYVYIYIHIYAHTCIYIYTYIQKYIAAAWELLSIPTQSPEIVARFPLAFTRYSFTLRLLCTNQPFFHSTRPLALPTLVQYYSTTVGQYMTPLRHPVCISYTVQYW